MKFSVSPSNVTHAVGFGCVVDLENETSTDAVTLAIGTNPTNGQLIALLALTVNVPVYGTLTVNSVAGVANFSGLIINNAAVPHGVGNGYTLTATALTQTTPTNPPAGFQPGVASAAPVINQFQAGDYYHFPPSGAADFPVNTVVGNPNVGNVFPVADTTTVVSNPFNVA